MTVIAQPARVVIVDDTPDIRLMLRIILDRSPELSVIAEAEDGCSAIERARELQPDLMLLDLSMPVMDGLQALPHIKKAAPACHVVVLSAMSAAEFADRAIAAGADCYVQKGTRAQELVDTLRHIAVGELQA